jgi:hypothetical protein
MKPSLLDLRCGPRLPVPKKKSRIVLTEADIFAWRMEKATGVPLTGVTITLRIRLPNFPIERVRVHLREEIFLAKLRVDALWVEGCELGKNAIAALEEAA